MIHPRFLRALDWAPAGGGGELHPRTETKEAWLGKWLRRSCLIVRARGTRQYDER